VERRDRKPLVGCELVSQRVARRARHLPPNQRLGVKPLHL
jgi:hypothetical protein